MTDGKSLGEKLVRLREQRGWTIYAACEHMPNIGRQSLIRLESGEAEPRRVSVQTLFDLFEVYLPDINLSDFTDDPRLRKYKVVRRHNVPPEEN